MATRIAVMNLGVLQQVGTPQELYDNPVNLFVAGFIGSPPMNFLPGIVEGDRIRLPLVDVPLDDRLRAAVGEREIVIVGIRPDAYEDIDTLEPHKAEGGVRFEADVDVTEWLGEVLYAYVPFETHDAVREKLAELDRDLDGEGMRTQLVVTLDSMSTVRAGDAAELWFHPDSMHIFDAETGESLTRDEDRASELEEEAKEQRRRALERAKRRVEREAQTAAEGEERASA